jgi:hypothetical protein
VSTRPSDEGARHLVDQMMITLPAELAAELEQAVDEGAVEWSDAAAYADAPALWPSGLLPTLPLPADEGTTTT